MIFLVFINVIQGTRRRQAVRSPRYTEIIVTSILIESIIIYIDLNLKRNRTKAFSIIASKKIEQDW